eukprot:SAG11_NODE_35249_length_267_cov_1.166667_1_plen_21_part_10
MAPWSFTRDTWYLISYEIWYY